MLSLTDGITDYRISSKSYNTRGGKTFVGRVRWYQDGRYLWSDGCGVHRLTPEDAQHDAQLVAADRLNDLHST